MRSLLPLVEWVFIFLPLFFHIVIGIAIIRGGLPNTNRYKFGLVGSSDARTGLAAIGRGCGDWNENRV